MTLSGSAIHFHSYHAGSVSFDYRVCECTSCGGYVHCFFFFHASDSPVYHNSQLGYHNRRRGPVLSAIETCRHCCKIEVLRFPTSKRILDASLTKWHSVACPSTRSMA